MTAPAAPTVPLENLSGAVLEIGPGRRPHLPSGDTASWTGVEPDRAAARWLRERLEGRRATILPVGAEELPLPDDSIDTVVTSYALCSVRDPAAVLREVQRVLRPGGRFTFVEHVAAPRGSGLKVVQAALSPVTRLLDGCRPDRDTGDLIASVGFRQVDLHTSAPAGFLGIPIPHVAGSAYC